MRELKLRYMIDLVSNLGKKAKDDAQHLSASQAAIRKELEKTQTRLGTYERTMLRLGRMSNSSLAQQAEYFSKIAMSAGRAEKAVAKYLSTTGKVLGGAATATAGVAAAGFVVDRALQKPMDYDRTLGRMANTAYDDRDEKGRLAGKAELDASIMAAVNKFGGTRDEGAAALNEVIASGRVDVTTAKGMLPTLMKGATATGATPAQLAAIILKSKTMGIGLEDGGALIDEANAAGKAGSFELAEMAKELPAAMAAGQGIGLRGREGYRRILAMMQTSMSTAGSKPEAATNVVNLLGKIGSKDTANDFKKEAGIDLPAMLVERRAQGMNGVDAFIGAVDEIARKDKDYAAIQKKLAGTTDKGERTEMLQSMGDILQGKAIGKVIQDRQALMALVAEMNNRDYTQVVLDKTRNAQGSVDKDHAVISKDGKFAREKAINQGEASVSRMYNKSGVVGAYNAAGELMQANPTATDVGLGTAGVLGVGGALGYLGLKTGMAAKMGGLLVGGAGRLAQLGTAARLGGVVGMGQTLAGGLATKVAAGGAAAMGASAAAVAATGAGAYYGTSWLRNKLWAGSGFDNAVGRAGANVASFFGNNTARAALQAEADDDQRSRAAKMMAAPRLAQLPDSLLMLNSPGTPGSTPMKLGQATEIKVGEGVLRIDLRLADGLQATPSVMRQPSIIKINAGATNPAGVN